MSLSGTLKKSFPILILLVLVLSMTLTVNANTGIVDADVLNFREGPSVVTKRIGRIPGGTKVDILDTSNKDWFVIKYNGLQGYVSSDYIKADGDASYGTGTVNATALHIRKSPSTSSTVLGKFYNNDKVEIISKEGSWYKVKYKNDTAYVYSAYINLNNSNSTSTKNEGKKYEVTCNILNLRKGPSTSSSKVGRLKRGDVVTLIETSGKWFYIKDSSGNKAYVHSDYVKLAGSSTSTVSRGNSTKVEPANTNTSNDADELIKYAKQFLGTKYVYGGASPSGFDCSGFTSYVFKQFGYKLNRVSRDQANNGVKVSKSNLQKGDLLLFSSSRSSNKIGHVGIYIGGGDFIHASSGSKYRVIISSLSEPFYVDTYITARRILK